MIITAYECFNRIWVKVEDGDNTAYHSRDVASDWWVKSNEQMFTIAKKVGIQEPTAELEKELSAKKFITFSEDDFDFSEDWSELDYNKKADFCSFVKALCDIDGKNWWEYYQAKNSIEL